MKMQRTKITNRLYKQIHDAKLKQWSAEELIELINKENPTKHDFIDMIIRAQYLLDTAENMYDMNDARITLCQIKDEFYGMYPEEYEEWWLNANG